MKLKWVKDLNDPTLNQLLTAPTTQQNLIAALYDQDIPIAAGYASIDRDKIQIENPYFINQNALKIFLEEMEKESLSKQLQSSILLYPDELDLTHSLLEIGWSEPEKWMINCYFDHDFNPPWLNREYKLPSEYHLKRWNQLTEDQKNHLQTKEGQLVFPPNLSPFLHSNHDPEYSLALLYNQEVIGWMMTRKIKEDTISFDSFFVEPKYRQVELVLYLLAESVKRVLSSPIPYAIMEVNLKQTNSSYINFVYKRYVPFINKYNYTLRSWKLTKT